VTTIPRHQLLVIMCLPAHRDKTMSVRPSTKVSWRSCPRSGTRLWRFRECSYCWKSSLYSQILVQQPVRYFRRLNALLLVDVASNQPAESNKPLLSMAFLLWRGDTGDTMVRIHGHLAVRAWPPTRPVRL
jgi:hypothetical protein